MMTAFVADWPGKSDAQGNRHPAVWHMLDVAAVARLILPQGPLGGLPPQLRNALLLLIALHDCGKISDSFRNQIVQGQSPAAHNRHWQLSYRILMQHDGLIAAHLGGEDVVREILYAAVAGHHGRPPLPHPVRGQDDAIGAAAFADVAALIGDLASLFAPASLAGLDEAAARRLSWLLSGVTVQADWIGSNDGWFPFTAPDRSIAAYWNIAQGRAQPAVDEAGLAPVTLQPMDARALIGADLRPMQQAVSDCALPDGPMLAVIEDATGAGKTEAAMILAQRMMEAGKAGGIYFALPTMATAEAMFARMRPVIGRLFAGAPSLALLHGRRALSDGFREVRGNTGQNPNDAGCAAWIADDRRRSLLAQIGVGTIDQALMAVLPTRFNTLRMAALARRILIVDEAHSHDPYMQAELEALLRFHAAFGGSAIVMTATLPTDRRAGLVRAWLKRDRRMRGDPQLPEMTGAYPALTLVAADTSSRAVDPVPATCRRIAVRRLVDMDAAVRVIADAQARGAACIWVRNAVDDAIAAVKALRGQGIAADLLHARFAMCDRLSIERDAVARFGRDGRGRAGRVLVATQIAEMSLDLDFDLMVSDLAPAGALVQRAGRLWRHMDRRPAASRPVGGPVLHLLSPDPDAVADDRWLHRVQPAGAWVYPQDLQWRTARALMDAGAIVAPDGLRALMAAADGDAGAALPAPLERAEIERIGREAAETGQARQNLLNPAQGYGAVENVFSDTVFPTRLGVAQMVLILMRRDAAGGLTPWAKDTDPVRALALSEVSMSLKRYRELPISGMQNTPEVAAITARWKDWERATRAIAIVPEDGAICEGLHYDPDRGLIFTMP